MLECMELKIMAEWAFIVPRCPSFLSLALSLSLSRSPSLFLSLSLPDFDAAGRATTRLAKRCCAQNERRNAEKRNQWLEIYPFLETGNK